MAIIVLASRRLGALFASPTFTAACYFFSPSLLGWVLSIGEFNYRIDCQRAMSFKVATRLEERKDSEPLYLAGWWVGLLGLMDSLCECEVGHRQ